MLFQIAIYYSIINGTTIIYGIQNMDLMKHILIKDLKQLMILT